MTPNPTMPRVHLNGTSKDELLRQQLAAISALRVAVEGLAQAAPNARDYYVIGPTAFEAARKQHETRMHRLADNIRELTAIAEAIDQQ